MLVLNSQAQAFLYSVTHNVLCFVTHNVCFRSRSQLDHPEDLDNLKSSDLKGQIEELRGIKASVNNELRDLESKRQGLLSEIANLKTQVCLGFNDIVA